ncbi:response regulator [Paenibacillus radicis (ex Xue et al. 2023)]|nr:response regulator [Paenibacillus radicis (ex Xue et al. 2023)]
MKMNPLTVLVVDDELPLREELRLFPWSACSAELVGEAENGAEALELCRKLSPDVVITDITMPIMDGMELFRIIKSEFPQTQVILLTCHSDFEYARDAIKLGALEYLIKISLLDSELEQALDRARQAIDRDRNHRRSELDKQRWQLSMLLSQPGAGAMVPDILGPLFKTWKLEFPLRFIRIHLNVRAENEMYVHHELQLALSEWETATRTFYRWLPLGNTDYLLLCHSPIHEQAPLLHEQVKSILASLQDELDHRLSFVSEAVRLFAVISEAIQEPSSLLPEINRVRLPSAAFFYDSTEILYNDTLEGSGANAPMSEQIKNMLLAQIREAAACGRDELIHFVRTGFTDWANGYRPDPEELKQWLLESSKELFKTKGSEHGTYDKVLQRIAVSRTLAELTASMIRELETADGAKSRCRKEVVMAKQMIAQRLAEPITLTLISEEVGLSSFYLSRLFREEVGESFNEYITRLRIAKAISLLQTTSMKVYEVAEQVGIPSYRYFSVLFRNRTGVSPTDFKKG